MTSIKSIWLNNKGFILFLGLMFVLRSAVADWSYIPSSSMNPTLIQGDRVGVNKVAYSLRVPFTLHHLVRWGAPERGDVITFDSPLDEVNLIKRVVAIAGDTVEMRDNTVLINGQAVQRKLIETSRLIPSEMGPLNAEIWQEQLGQKTYESAKLVELNRFKDFDAVQVPAGHILVLGDSRDNSNDSRFIGFIDVNRITGRAERVVMSHDPESFYLPRSGRWWLAL